MKFKLLLLASLFCCQISQNFAQIATPAPEKADPEAKKLLDKVRKAYDRYTNLEVNFILTIEVSEQAKEVQKGSVAQSDKKFRLEMPTQTIISDGKTTWVHLKKENEVQINDTDPKDLESAFFTPKELLRRYQKGDFLYAITDKSSEKNVVLTHVEFKPKDKNSEFSKIRVHIDEKNLRIHSIKAFAKDGSRYTFEITKFAPNKQFAPDFFTFNPAKFAGIRVEDLRI